MMTKEARLMIVIGIKNAICTGFATQPVTSAFMILFTVRLQDAGGGVLEVIEYKNLKYVTCGMSISKGTWSEELLAVQTSSTRMPCIIASYNGR